MSTASSRPGSSDIVKNDEEFNKLYLMGPLLGDGAYGLVYKAHRIADNALVAVKKINSDFITKWEKHNGVWMPLEEAFLRMLAHIPGVVNVIDSCDCGSHYMIVTETTEDTIDLSNHLDSVFVLTESKARDYIKQVIETLISCYRDGVAHRDIKPDNLLLNRSTETITVIDFGNAAYSENEPVSGVCGTPLYCPPECFDSTNYFTNKAAVWSIGITLYQMLSYDLPFQTVLEITLKKVSFSRVLSEDCKDFIRDCLKKNIDERPPLESLLCHRFFHQQN